MKHGLLWVCMFFAFGTTSLQANTPQAKAHGDMQQLTQNSDHVLFGTVTEIQTEHKFTDSALLGRHHVVEVSVLIEPSITLKTNKQQPLGLIRVPITSLSKKQWRRMKPSFYDHFMGKQHVVFLQGDSFKPTSRYSFMQDPSVLATVALGLHDT